MYLPILAINISQSHIPDPKPSMVFASTQFLPRNIARPVAINLLIPKKCSADLNNLHKNSLRQDVDLGPVHMKAYKNTVNELCSGCKKDV